MNPEQEKKPRHAAIMARDIMTEVVEVVHKTMTIGQVAHMMLRERISGYPVIDDHKNVVGIVTLTDLFLLIDDVYQKGEEDFYRKITEVKSIPIAKVMSTNVYTIKPTTVLAEIICAVVYMRIHSFPVMENGKLVGIIGRHDILNAVFNYI